MSIVCGEESRHLLGSMPYTGGHLYRGGRERSHTEWVSEMRVSPNAQGLAFWRDDCIVRGGLPAMVSPGDVTGAGQDDWILLGLRENGSGNPLFALDLSDIGREEAIERVHGDGVLSVRELFPNVDMEFANHLAFSRGMLRWHRSQRYCGACGSRADAMNGGSFRQCTGDECRAVLFPKIEPAVIVRVVSKSDPEQILLARHSASTKDRYSLLAGFVEVGESLEEAVRREVLEEVGVHVGRTDFLGSQPWPFPAGLMVGFEGEAVTREVLVDHEEIAEARWFTREELRIHQKRSGRLGRPDSIDRRIISQWLLEEAETL